MKKTRELNIYAKLLEQPLFQGMSKGELEQMISHTKFDFFKYKDNETIVKEGDVCDRLRFMTNGILMTETSTDDKGLTLYEELRAPYVMQPERIFGLTQRYTKSYTAKGDCNLMTLDKNEIINLSDRFMIFRLNLLNIISTQAQKNARRQWRHTPDNLRQRITRFLEIHCERPAGLKVIRTKMTKLANELNDNRLSISQELNKMQEEGLITLKREYIFIPAFERLIM